MKAWMRSLMASRFGPYLQLLIPLLLLTALIFGLMATTGCGGCGTTSSPHVQKHHTFGASYQCSLTAGGSTTQPLGWTTRTIGGASRTIPGPSSVTYSYTPPDGASNFKWDPDHPPENPNGPPPYIFRDVPAGQEINVEFQNPDLHAGTISLPYAEVLQADHGDGSLSSAARSGQIGAQVPPLSVSPRAVTGTGVDGPAQDDELWEVGRWIDIYGITLTTSLCDDWLGVLQSDAAFLAARVPIVPPALPTGSYTIPLAIRAPESATVTLVEWGEPAPHMTAPVELRPERFTFANNELPGAPGEAYVALGLSQEPLACPTGLNVAADDWGLFGSVWLDLQVQPDNCEGCSLPTYYCYEGQELPDVPPLTELLGLSLARTAGLTTYQGQGITCLGPQHLTLVEDPEWQLSGASTGWFTPTAPISFRHYIYNWSDFPHEPITCTIGLSSTLGDVWALYEGDWQGPTEPRVELTQPIRVEDWDLGFWVIADPPAPPDPGHYTLVLTGTCQGAAGEQMTSDLLWIGGWIAPPPPPEGTRYRVYLPLLLRNYE